MRLLRAALVMLPLFAAACGDDDENGGDVAGVFPDEGFVGRTLRVEVTGDTTSWDAASTLNFGDGITVANIEVVSPQSLQADITIAPTTAAGAHDVTVTDGGTTFTLPAAFNLVAPVESEVLELQQGGFGQITLTNLDLLNPFDTSTDPDTGDFIGVSVTSTDTGVALSIADVTTDTIVLSATADVLATTTGAITVTSTTDGADTVTLVDPVAVTARAAQVITPGTPATFTMAGNGSLLEITATQTGLLNLRLTTADTELAGSPGFGVLPASGKFDDLIVVHQNFNSDLLNDAAIFNQFVTAGDKFYIVALELGFFSGTPGYQASFDATEISLAGVTAVTDTGDNNATNQAQQLTGAIARFDGVLTNIDDVDCFKISTTAANQKIHVYTTDDDGATDNIVTIFNNDTAGATSIADSTDADLGEDLVSGALAATISRSICVSPSTFLDEITNGAYSAVVVIEAP